MKHSKKYKQKLKKRLLITMSSIAVVLMLVSGMKLAGFSAPENNDDTSFISSMQRGINNIKKYLGIESESSVELDGVTINGKYFAFDKNQNTYDINLDYNVTDLVTIEADKQAEEQEVKGEGSYIVRNIKTITLKVISANKSYSNTYTLNLSRSQHSNYLKSLELPDYSITPEFSPEVTSYTMEKLSTVTELDVFATAFDKEANIKISGNTNMQTSGAITITVSEPHIDTNAVYVINYNQTSTVHNYSYNGKYQTFVVPYTGWYKMQCWGARGGGSRVNGSFNGTYGKGGYASGDILLTKGEKYYIYVGGQGTDSVVRKNSAGGWNGGGYGTWDNGDDETSGGGGGATDVRLIGDTWDNIKSLRSRIMVAGGGGGTSWKYSPGHGGGINGISYYSGVSPAGTQTSGYQFGIGRNGWGIADNDGVAGGGGGYYGGQTNNVSGKSSGAGGSGYISGHIGCIAVKSEDDTTPKVSKYSKLEDSYHYSGKIFTGTILTAGDANMPTYDGTSTMTGNASNGYAKITLMSTLTDTYPISNISIDNGSFTENFNPSVYEYYAEIDSEKPVVHTTITPTSDEVVVENGLVQEITTEAGLTTQEIHVTGKDGKEYIYHIHFVRNASSYPYLDDILLDKVSLEGFNSTTLQYHLNLPYYVEETAVLEAIKARPNQKVTGVGTIDTSHNTTMCAIEVTSEDETNTVVYNMTFTKQPSSKLKFLDIKNQDFARVFESDKYEYEFDVTSGVVSLDITAIPYDEEAKVSIKGAGYIKEGRNTVTVTVSREGVADTVYTIYVQKGESLGEMAYDFDYTGEYQVFVAPAMGHYKFECWGASGGRSIRNGGLCEMGGLGGYTSGVIKLNEGDTFYIYVGGQGANAKLRTNVAGGWNGGGYGTWDQRDDECSGGGGGATDIRLVAGNWNDTESLKNRIMVAGAGGGRSWSYEPGPGGGLSGYSYYGVSKPGTQTSGYGFGVGKDGWGVGDSDGVAGGGSGYYGGETNNVSYQSSGAGGSSYISGHDGCNAISEESSTGNIVHTGQSIHYSGFKFKDTVMIDGAGYEWTDTKGSYVKMEDPSGNFVNGKTGNGYARITLLEDPSENNLLKELQISYDDDKHTIPINTQDILDKVFSYDDTEYTINVEPDITSLIVYGVQDDVKATVEGNGTYDILPGDNEIKLNVTAESGDVKTYTLTVKRSASDNAKPIDITIDGLIESLINVNPIYGKLDPEEFDPDTYEYSMIVPSRIKRLTFNVEKGHPYQTVEGDGVVSLAGGDNTITINVTSEDGENTETYTYHIERDMSGNCLLESLTIDNVETDLEFDPQELEYFITVPNEIDHLDITAIPEIKTIVPQIVGNTNLKTGLNDVYILVTAENGEQLVYVIHTYRMMSGNTFLDYIKVLNNGIELVMEPTYNKILDTYIITVPNEIDRVTIQAKTEVDTSTVTGIGNKILKTGSNQYELKVTAEDGSVGTYTVLVTRDKSDNNYLKRLIASQGDFDKEFDKEENEYHITVDSTVDKLNLNVATEDPTAKYTIIGNNNFVCGDNEVIVRVTAENGDVREYKIIVERLPSDNNDLLNLWTNYGTLSPTFKSDTLEYEVEVDNEVEIITVSATKAEAHSTITGTGKYALQVGENEVNVAVQAEDGTMKTYTLIITRKMSSNVNLLRIDNDKQAVVKKVNNEMYLINVSNETTKIDITGVPEKATSTVSGNGEYNLNIGSNNILLKVKAEDGTEKEYVVLVERAKSNNANLKYLFVEEGALSPAFSKDITDYTVKPIFTVDELNLDIEPEDSDATYQVVGNSNLKYGINRITIIVTASDGKTQKYYNLTVYKQGENIGSNELMELTVDKGKLVPDFDPETVVYDVTVPYTTTSITVSATAIDANATITGLGEYQLEVGKNVIPVIVTSTDGIEKTYQIRVTREKSNEARLTSLAVEGCNLSPVFDPDTTSYSIETTLSKINLTAIPMEPDATYEIIGDTNLEKGTNILTVRVTAPNGTTTKDYTLKAVRSKSNNNNLASLRVVGYEISPEFSKTTLLYSTTVEKDVNTVMIEATADEENATITGIGNVVLQKGKNTVEVVVTSETGKTKKYTVIIYKEASTNNYLESLQVSDGELDPVFDKMTNGYRVEVPYETDNIILTGTLEDEKATVKGLGKHDLQVGENPIQVVVTSEAGVDNTYTVTVVRKEAVSAKLKKLDPKPYKLDPKFNMDLMEYTVVVDNEITSLNLDIETLDPHATYVVTGNENFVVGMNTVTIEVTSSNGIDKETYTLYVNRQLSSNNYLDYILPSSGTLTPTYSKTTIYYEVNVGNDITDIHIDAEPSDEKATLTGTGDYTLKTGNNYIELKVTSVTGVTRTYTVNVIRAKNNNNYLKSLSLKNGSQVLELVPMFNKEIEEYTVQVPEGVTRAQILAEAENSLSTLTGTGYVTVVAGQNTYAVNVKAEDGSVRTYTINLQRPKSSNNYLTELIPSVGTLSPSFGYNETTYDLELGNLDSLLSFEVNTENRFASVTGIEEQAVPDGASVRTIVVTAEDGTTRTYTINVFRKRTDDARLASLQVKSYILEQEFNEDLFDYTLTVPNDKFELTENEIVAVPKYEESTVYLTPIVELSVLEPNVYTIIVTAPDGYTTQKYTITVTRRKSSNSSLAKLAVSGYEITPEFTSENTIYNLSLPKGINILASSDVIAIPTDQYATVTKMESLDLTKGNRYTVSVTSHDETSTTVYTIIVDNEKAENNYLESLTVTPGELEPAFDTNIVNYDVHVFEDQEEVVVNAVPADPTATVVAGTGTIKLTGDKTEILVLIQAENEKLRGYIINVYRDVARPVLQFIKGSITTENVNGIYKASVSLYKQSDAINTSPTSTIETSEDGTYEFEVEAGTYNIVVSKPGYLSYTVTNINIKEGEEVNIGEHKLIAGDVLSDGEIEISDLVGIGDKIGVIITDENKAENSKYDLNEDGIIDSLDRNILKSNYTKKSEIVEWVNPNPMLTMQTNAITAQVGNGVTTGDLDAIIQETTRKKAKEGEEEDDEEEEEEIETVANNTAQTTTLILPLKTAYTITSPYGERVHPVTGELKKHTGIDLSGEHHAEVNAIAEGEVVYAGDNGAFGNSVEIKHIVNGETIYSFYAHLSQINVEVGQTVGQGEVIGLEGGAESDPGHGSSTGHHLHFEIRTASGYGNDVDPNEYIAF